MFIKTNERKDIVDFLEKLKALELKGEGDFTFTQGNSSATINNDEWNEILFYAAEGYKARKG